MLDEYTLRKLNQSYNMMVGSQYDLEEALKVDNGGSFQSNTSAQQSKS